MSSHNATDAFPPTDRDAQEPGYPLVYVNLGRPRVALQTPGGRIDLSWQEWGDLVADVGSRFTALALALPDVLERVREDQVRTVAQAAAADRAREQGP